MKLHVKILTLLLSVIFSASFAQVERAKIIVAYLNNFAKYTNWPNEAITDSFRIVVLTENADVKKEVLEFSKKRTIKEKAVSIQFSQSISLKKLPQMVVLLKDKSELLPEIYNMIEGKPVLLVSEEYPDQRNVMINLIEKQGKLLFEINKANLLYQNLNVEPEILLAGGSEIDVAAMYRASQYNIRTLQKYLNTMKDSVLYFQKQISSSAQIIKKQQEQIDEQRAKLESNIELLNSKQRIINNQEVVLKNQRDSALMFKNVLRKLQEQVGTQWNESKKLEKNLAEKLAQIDSLNKEILDKNYVLSNQNEIILRQRQLLWMSIIVGVLVILIIIIVIYSYVKIRKKSRLIEQQNKEIELQLEELKKLNEALKTADQYKSIFLASMSHELRTPLNSIIGYTGILLMGMTGELNDEQKNQLSKVKNNARHLLSLINDILDISKIEAGKVELQFEEFRLSKLVAEVLEIIQPKAAEKQLELACELRDDVEVYTDYRRLKQVVLNLAANAVNYTEKGSVAIITEKVDELMFRLTVRDTGIGIEEKELPRLFQPFQQIDSSLTKKNKGTGLGLFLCKKLVNLLEGEIFVKSEIGKGSSFFIEIPIRIIDKKSFVNETSIDN